MIFRKRFLFIAGCAMLTLWLAACGAKNPAESTVANGAGNSPAETKPAEPTPDIPAPEAGELRQIILDSFSAQDDIAWRYNSSTTLENGETHTTLVEFQPHRRYHIVSDGKGGLIIYDDKVYAFQNNGWILTDIPIDSIIDPQATERLEKSIDHINYIGAETLGGKSMWVCQYQALQKSGESESTISVTIWIGYDDRLPYKLNIVGQTMAIDSQSGEVKGIDSTSTVLYEYDPTITIDQPQTP